MGFSSFVNNNSMFRRGEGKKPESNRCMDSFIDEMNQDV